MKWNKKQANEYDIDIIIKSLLSESKNELIERIIENMSDKELSIMYKDIKEYV